MKIDMPYSQSTISTEIDDHRILGVLKNRPLPAVEDLECAVQRAIQNPIGSPPLREIVSNGDKIVIIVNDITRPSPSEIMVREIVRELNELEISDQDITIVIATGTHRPNTPAEMKKMLGPIADRFQVFNHDCQDQENLVYIGDTSQGLEIYINKLVARANIRILTGIIAPHHGAGFSGGRKSIVPGVASLRTLKEHHSLPIRSFNPVYGVLHGNSFHEQAVEATRLVGVDFIVNVVPNAKKEIVAVVAGDLEEAHEAGANICRQMCEVTMPEKADIVLTSPGGYPRDINLYQALKAVATAEMAVKPEGVIILVAECPEPIEDTDFPRWLRAADTPKEVIERFQKEGFTIGSAKAFALARAVDQFQVIIVSEKIAVDELDGLFVTGATTLEDAFEIAEKIVGHQSKVLIIPHGNNLIPKEKEL